MAAGPDLYTLSVIIQGDAHGLTGSLAQSQSSLRTFGSAVRTNVSGSLSSARSEIRSFGTAARSGLGAATSSIVSGARSAGSALRSGITGNIAEARAEIRTFGTSVRSQFNDAGQAIHSAASETLNYADRNKTALNSVAKGAGVAGAALVAFAAVSVKAYADYESKMAQVQSLTKANSRDMNRLSDANKGFAEEFGISASQAADAEIELVKAGVSVNDIIGGALKGTLTLAAAGQMDVADATTIASAAMVQFGLKGTDVTHIADLLAAGADKALGGVQDLGEGLKYVGPVASSMGISLEETVGVLSEFASNGILAEQGGTSLRGVLLSLTAPSKAASKVMDQYGISLYDGNKKFIGVAGAAQQLQDKLGGLDDATRQAALGQIFGNAQVTAATILMRDGAAGVEKWTEAVDEQGFAAQQASGKMDSLTGDLTKFKASLTNALIDTGEGGKNPFRALVQGATDVVNAYNKLPAAAKQGIFAVAGGLGTILLVTAGLAKMVTGLAAARTAMNELGISSTVALGKVGKFGVQAGVVATKIFATVAALTALDSATNRNAESSKELAAGLDKVVDGADPLSTLFDGMNIKARGFDGSFRKLLGAVGDESGWESAIHKVDDWGGSITRIFDENTPKFGEIRDRLKDVDTQLADMSTVNLPKVQAAFAKLYDAAGGDERGGEMLLTSLPQLRDQLVGMASDAGLATDDAELLKIALGQVDPAAEAAKNGANKVGTSAQQSAAQMLDAQKAAQEWADNLTQSAGSFLDFSAKADDAKLSLDGWIKQLEAQAKAQENWASNMAKAAKRGVSDGVLQELAKLGPEGALRVKQLADGSKKDIDRVNKAFASAGQSMQDLNADMAAAKGPKIDVKVDTEPAKKGFDDALGLFNSAPPASITVHSNTKPAKQSTSALLDWTNRSSANVDVGGDNGPGKQSTNTLLGYIASSSANVTIGANTGPALGAMGALQAAFGQKTFYVGVTALPKKAEGGAIHGVGGPKQDNVLIAASVGEFVVKSSAYAKHRDLVEAINNDDLPAYASGGVVASARRQVSSRRTTLRRAREHLKSAKKTKSEKDDDRAQKALDRAQDAYDKAVDRYQSLVQSQADIRTEARRGNIKSEVTGGLDSAYSAIDEVISASHDTNLTKGQRSSLAKVAREAEPALRSLYKQADGIASRLEKAKNTLAAVKDVRAQAVDVVKSTFDLSQAIQTNQYGYTSTYTKASILSTGKKQANVATTFATKFKTMQKKLGSTPGANAIAQQALSIFGQDPEQGIAFVSAINSMSASELHEIKADYNKIGYGSSSAAGVVGDSAAKAFYDGGVAGAQGFVDGLKDDQADINRQIAAWGKTLTNAMLKPYGLKLDKKGHIVKRAMGGWVRGGGTATSDSNLLAASNGEFVVRSSVAQANAPLLEWLNGTGGRTVTVTPRAGMAASAKTTSADVKALASAVATALSGWNLTANVNAVAGVSRRTAAEVVHLGLSELVRSGDPLLRKVGV